MHSPISQTEAVLKEMAISLPVEVIFAGFTSTTDRLANAGWDISMNQQMEPRHGRTFLQMALRYEPAGIYALSMRNDFEWWELQDTLRSRNSHELAQFLLSMPFNVQHMSSRGIVVASQSNPSMGVSSTFGAAFAPIDPYPSFIQEDVKDFKFFRAASPSVKDIIVSPEQEPEIMKLLLDVQNLTQEKIKDKMKRAERHAQVDQMLGSRTINAQIITLAS